MHLQCMSVQHVHNGHCFFSWEWKLVDFLCDSFSYRRWYVENLLSEIVWIRLVSFTVYHIQEARFYHSRNNLFVLFNRVFNHMKTYLHGESLATAGLAISENANIIPVYAGSHQRLHFVEHLMEGIRVFALFKPGKSENIWIILWQGWHYCAFGGLVGLQGNIKLFSYSL